MRKSSMPSQLGKPRAAAGPSTTSRSGRAVTARGSYNEDACGDGDDDTETLHREGICGLLYSKDHMSQKLAGQLKATHVHHREYKMPSQDPTKVQFFDPDRGKKSLGMTKPGANRPRPSVAPLALPMPSTGKVEDENYTFEPLILWETPDEPDEAADAAAGGAADGEGAEGAAADGDAASAAAAAEPKPKKEKVQISVDGCLCRFLRSHQREGTQFLFNCLMNSGGAGEGLRDFEGQGCILADDMGLGKTLQSITICWTLMTQGFEGKPAVTHTIVACPVSLVTNWEKEFKEKWIGMDRLKARGIDVIAVAEAKKHEVKMMCQRFTYGRSAILIISYETFRLNEKLFRKGNQCGLLICDEAHRLKNKDTKTAVALARLPCTKRVLLSGTPIQNDLDEFYSMVHFANPGLLGTEKDFHRNYQNPILRGREPDATDKDRKKGEGKGVELGQLVNQFILRRTNTLLSDHLPPKLVCVVCCSLSKVQLDMYERFLKSKFAKQLENGGKQTLVLASITSLKKLCNHPSLIIDHEQGGKVAEGFEECVDLLPPSAIAKAPRGGQPPPFDPSLSGKFHVLHKLLKFVRATSDDKFVLISNYTQTLSLFERMCQQEGWKCCKLDGSCNIKQRTKMVEDFNNPNGGLYCFLLSSKAGGCGLNLIGGNRLVLFDPDWNPANDKQAAARVWRDGQKKRCYLYRMLCAGSIEEKVFERQLSKEGLAGVATNEDIEKSTLSRSELKDLFSLHTDMPSHLHFKLMEEQRKLAEMEAEASDDDDDDDDNNKPGAAAAAAAAGAFGEVEEKKGSGGKGKEKMAVVVEEKAPRPDGVSDVWKEQEGWPKETGDMHLWGHHLGTEKVDDPMLRDAARTQSEDEGTVSFTFSLQVQGRLESYWERKGGARPAYMNRPAVGNGGEAVAAAGAEGAKGGEAARDPKKGWLHLPAKRVEEAGGSGSDGEEEEEAAAASGSEYEDGSEDDDCSDDSEAGAAARRRRKGGGSGCGKGGTAAGRAAANGRAPGRATSSPYPYPALPSSLPVAPRRLGTGLTKPRAPPLPPAAAQVQGKLKPIDEGGGSGSGGGGGKENGAQGSKKPLTTQQPFKRPGGPAPFKKPGLASAAAPGGFKKPAPAAAAAASAAPKQQPAAAAASKAAGKRKVVDDSEEEAEEDGEDDEDDDEAEMEEEEEGGEDEPVAAKEDVKMAEPPQAQSAVSSGTSGSGSGSGGGSGTSVPSAAGANGEKKKSKLSLSKKTKV